MERAQEDSIDHAENGRVSADAQRQRDNGNQSKAGALDQHSRPVTQVLPESLEPRPSPHLSCDFFDKADIAEFPARRLSGFAFGLTALNSVARGHFKMASDLFFEFFIPPPPPKWELHASSSFRTFRVIRTSG